MKYECDRCRHNGGEPPRRPYAATDGREYVCTIEYVRCRARRPLWTVEKRTFCEDFEEVR